MATRSNIGIVNEDGSITGIYCHYDGYPEYVGKMLLMVDQVHSHTNDRPRSVVSRIFKHSFSLSLSAGFITCSNRK